MLLVSAALAPLTSRGQEAKNGNKMPEPITALDLQLQAEQDHRDMDRRRNPEPPFSDADRKASIKAAEGKIVVLPKLKNILPNVTPNQAQNIAFDVKSFETLAPGLASQAGEDAVKQLLQQFIDHCKKIVPGLTDEQAAAIFSCKSNQLVNKLQ